MLISDRASLRVLKRVTVGRSPLHGFDVRVLVERPLVEYHANVPNVVRPKSPSARARKDTYRCDIFVSVHAYPSDLRSPVRNILLVDERTGNCVFEYDQTGIRFSPDGWELEEMTG